MYDIEPGMPYYSTPTHAVLGGSQVAMATPSLQ